MNILYDFLEFINVCANKYDNIIAILLPIFVMLITLKHNKRNIGMQLNAQNKIHEVQMLEMENANKNALEQAKAESLLNIKPFLVLKSTSEIREENSKCYFIMKFLNEGNGSAVNIQYEYIECPVIVETFKNQYRCITPFDYYKCVLNIKDSIEAEVEIIFINKIREDYYEDFNFSIKYQDMMENWYCQSHKIVYRKHEILRVHSSIPRLIENF